MARMVTDEFSLFDDLSVGKKIGLGFGLTMVFFVVVVLQYHGVLFQTLRDTDRLQSVHGAKKTHSLNIHRYMLEARRSEKDFLARKKLRYVDRVKEYVGRILAETEQLRLIEERAGGQRVAENIRERIEIYHAAFQAIVQAWRDKGLDHESGLQGRFRQSIHQVEAKAGNFKIGALYLTLLQIRRGEKDLGLRRDVKYVERVRMLGRQFRDQIGASSVDPETRTTLEGAMDDYLREFELYAQHVLEGKGADGGKGAFRDIAHHLEGLLRTRYVFGLEEDILMLRRHEKDYLLRGDKTYVAQARIAVQRILDNIAGSEIPNHEKQALEALVREYAKDFLVLVEQNDRIVELTAGMRHAVHQIEPLVASNVTEAVKDMDRMAVETRANVRETTFVALSIAAVAILVGLAFSIFISHRISRPVITLMNLAKLVAGGNPDSGEMRQKDEIAALSAAMGRMAGTHQQMLEHLEDYTEDLDGTAKTISTAAGALHELAGKVGEPSVVSIDREKCDEELLKLAEMVSGGGMEMTDVVKGLREILERYEEF
ncbi:MAG: methyl-accepting chemotaxis protein [Gammaproteobacteria bacterium]|nr:methyl-accepting chemotaxis protein [Gammaproteobacteria bacterium]